MGVGLGPKIRLSVNSNINDLRIVCRVRQNKLITSLDLLDHSRQLMLHTACRSLDKISRTADHANQSGKAIRRAIFASTTFNHIAVFTQAIRRFYQQPPLDLRGR